MNKNRTFTLARMAIFIALLCVSAYIAITVPFSSVPITAQTLVVNLIALLFVPQQALIIMVCYVLIGICGVPVFSGGTAGFARILGPAGGYVIGFIIMAFVISLLKGKKASWWRYLLVTICVGIPINYLCGMVTMRIYLGMDFKSLLMVSTLPYIPGDVIKCGVAVAIAMSLEKINFRGRFLKE